MRNFYARCTPWGTVQTGDWFRLLPESERAAVLAHERGHLYHRHTWKRLGWFVTGRAFFQMEKFFAMCEAQELEADRYAQSVGHGPALAAFLTRRPTVKAIGYPSAIRRIEALNV